MLTLRVSRLYLADPVILTLTALLAGIVVYSITSKAIIHIAYTSIPPSDEFIKLTGINESHLVSLLRYNIYRDIVESFILLGVVTTITGAYLIGMGRDQGYSSLPNLLGIGRRSYIRAQVLHPTILYLASTTPATIIALSLIDPNLLKYWKIIATANLLILSIIELQLTIALLATYILANTYRGIVTTLAILTLTTTIGAHKSIWGAIGNAETLNQALTVATTLTLITTVILIIAYIIIETRMPTR